VLERSDSKLLSMQWDKAPRNVMIVKKPGVEAVGNALVEFAECDYRPRYFVGKTDHSFQTYNNHLSRDECHT
jgi:hypothetical protein